MYDIKVSLQNIGKVDAATIDMNGVTVLTGKSNTGKSTVSKAIYSVLNVFNTPKSEYYQEKIDTIEEILQNKIIPKHSDLYVKRYFKAAISVVAENLVSYIDYACKKHPSDDKLLDKLTEFLEEQCLYDICLDDVLIEELQEVLTKPYDDLFWENLENQFNSEFKGTACNVLSRSRKPVLSTIDLEFNGTNLSFTLDKNGIKIINQPKSLNVEGNTIIYLDTPFILDNLNLQELRTDYHVLHNADFLEKFRFFAGNFESSPQDKFFHIYPKINEVCEGDITIQSETGDFQYILGRNQTIPLCNLASSVKVFALLKVILKAYKVDSFDILMLDGIEAHLPPSEQKLLAEILMMLHREHKIRVFVNTQSPYFLRAIEFFAEQYDVANDCKYYYAQEKKGRTRIKDVSSKLKPVYAELQEPFELNL